MKEEMKIVTVQLEYMFVKSLYLAELWKIYVSISDNVICQIYYFLLHRIEAQHLHCSVQILPLSH